LEAQPIKQVAQVGAVPIIPITAAIGSFALPTDMTCAMVHAAAVGGAPAVAALGLVVVATLGLAAVVAALGLAV
jgi:hypothetical protein